MGAKEGTTTRERRLRSAKRVTLENEQIDALW